MRKKFKFKKLLNEYRFLDQELKYLDEILVEANKYFEIYHREYCTQNDINLAELNSKHSDKVSEIFSDGVGIKLSVEKIERQKEYDSKDIFRQIARKFHPDTLKMDDPNKFEYEEVFKEASAAIDNGNWGKLFAIVDKYNLDLKEYDGVNECLKVDIKRTKQIVQNRKDSYAYLLYECEEDRGCKENVIKRFLKHLFNI